MLTSLTFTVPAAISTHPQGVAMFYGWNVTLLCKATGSDPIRYQWRRVKGEISSDRAKGVNTSTLTISSVTEQDEDEYYCVASYGIVNGTYYSDISSRANITIYKYGKYLMMCVKIRSVYIYV